MAGKIKEKGKVLCHETEDFFVYEMNNVVESDCLKHIFMICL